MLVKINRCWFCGKDITNENEVFAYYPGGFKHTEYWHKECAEKQGMDKEISNVSKTCFNNQSEKKAISALNIFAWINLLCGIIGAIVIWKTMGVVELPSDYAFTDSEINPFGIALGFIVLMQGFFGYVICSVVSTMADNVILIRDNI